MKIATIIKLNNYLIYLACLTSIVILAGCNFKSKKLQQELNTIDSNPECLKKINLSLLEKSIEKCNKLILKDTKNPELLSHRSLLYILAGKNKDACRDVSIAFELINKKNVNTNPMVLHELKVRQTYCKEFFKIEERE